MAEARINTAKMWFFGVTKPALMIDLLSRKPAPFYGLCMVLIRFIVTSATSILALYLLHMLPFTPSSLTFLDIENYYKAEIFFLPVWGIAIWILMGGIAYVFFRFLGNEVSIDPILNVIGIGMMIPMPFLWVWDWASIALQQYGLIHQAISHSIAQAWEASIQALGFRRMVKINMPVSVMIALLINITYVLLATVFIR